jgi:hypothetical protein
MSRIAFSLLAFLVAAGCSQRDATSPLRDDTQAARLSADQASPEAAPVEIAFEKWFTTYPAMTGNTSYGAGTYAGTILRRTAFDNGVIVQLEARYIVSDPSGEGHSFTAVIAGTENLVTRRAVLNGVVTEGWMVGARVHVTFEIITPCALAIGPSAKNVCFQGTIRLQ